MPAANMKQYLGDGLYASFDGFQIELKAEGNDGIINRVYLDDSVVRAFLKFIERAHRVQIQVSTVEQDEESRQE